jgi:iron complex transport system ATP-binding protein
MNALLALTGATVALNDKIVMRDISLTINGGEIVALLGPNGAGKTTFMRAALGFVPLKAGSVALSGDDPAGLSARGRALRVAYLPQRPQAIWPVSVERLVALGRYAYGAAPDRLSERDQAAVDAALRACSLTELRAQPMDRISGGEKARAHLARALAQRAPLLVLDEPTAGLDPAQTLAVADILHDHAGNGGAVLFSTHDVALAARLAQRIVLLREGSVVSEGAPVSALTSGALLQAYGRAGRLEHIDGDVVAVFR